MQALPKYPSIYEINTFVWLTDLGAKQGKAATLADVPEHEWDRIASLGFDAVWLMGVWERSPAGRKIAMRNGKLMEEFKAALPGFGERDLAGSAYCIKNYVVDRSIGGPEGLAHAREMLAKRGLRLILDFVPNHVAPDHPWVAEHPEYFVRGSEEDFKRDPSSFIRSGKNIIALGRDPYFPSWPDVVQLNAFNLGLRKAVLATVADIAAQCDGVRCDMAMLMMNGIFSRTWGNHAGERLSEDYWPTLIPAIKRRFPGFIFIAEAYWDLEWDLQQQGFDFCYDKKLYDRMEHCGAEEVIAHLSANMEYQDKLIRFIENHDEPRAAAAFHPQKEKMALLATATLPGAKLVHEGQLEGRKTRIPVFLGRRPDEPVDGDLLDFSNKLLALTSKEAFHNGTWQICDTYGWPDNKSCRNILAWTWRKDENRYLIVINFSGSLSQAMVKVPWNDLYGKMASLEDLLSGVSYNRLGSEMVDSGLYVVLAPWTAHFFKIDF